MMINNSTEGPWLQLQFHKQKSLSKLVIFMSLETHQIDVTVWGALLLHDICKNAVCNMPKWFMMQRRKRGFDKLLLLKNIWSRSFNCCWTLAFSSRLIYLTSHQAKWQPICILITVLCLQSTDNELLHIVCSDIFAARNSFSRSFSKVHANGFWETCSI